MAGVLAHTGRRARKDLRTEASQAFDRYARLTESRMDEEAVESFPFLWMDSLPGADGRDLR